MASKELYATGETKECLKAQQVPCPYRANEKPPAKLVDIYCTLSNHFTSLNSL
ncbi:hypothetical protein [Defluviitalea raffinosedens]|uniref:hypothetical protein n=1 Tax=Defluviitalea raffinosedens TaxID=1450156 RepID=UPI00131AD6B0|nr:hypothetical protein [Defluviitalea raffinosedens]